MCPVLSMCYVLGSVFDLGDEKIKSESVIPLSLNELTCTRAKLDMRMGAGETVHSITKFYILWSVV